MWLHTPLRLVVFDRVITYSPPIGGAWSYGHIQPSHWWTLITWSHTVLPLVDTNLCLISDHVITALPIVDPDLVITYSLSIGGHRSLSGLWSCDNIQLSDWLTLIMWCPSQSGHRYGGPSHIFNLKDVNPSNLISVFCTVVVIEIKTRSLVSC